MDDRKLELDLLEKIEKQIPKGRKSTSVEEAFARALGFEKEPESERITEDEWW